jgi:hypothetical protein
MSRIYDKQALYVKSGLETLILLTFSASKALKPLLLRP